jgi:SAM-dependent methyltransferase
MHGDAYPGLELDDFQHATQRKQYSIGHLRPFVRGDVLEVGAGIGGTSRFLCGPAATSWLCLEPDPALATRVEARFAGEPLPVPSRVVAGTVAALAPAEQFDTAVYIDVLEHIADDRGELAAVLRHLRPRGRLVVLAPAHQWLLNPFDLAIGHLRRYTVGSLRATAPAGLRLLVARYLDTFGILAPLGNQFLRRRRPSPTQIRFWDQVLVRGSRLVDPLLRYATGKAVIAVWERP